jgi:hypothetical protein
LKTYTKEWVGTLVFFGLYIIMGHTGLWFAPFAADSETVVLGFPLHYFVAIILGWFGLFFVSLAWLRWADRLEEEIAAEDVKETKKTYVSKQPDVAVSASNAQGGGV